MENSSTNPPTSVLSTLIPANPTAAWTPGPHSLNWKSDTYTVSRAQISDCVISDPNLYPVGGAKEFSQEPLGSMQALLDFGEEHREAGRPLFILMGGWTKQKEVDKDANMCVQTFRFCDHDGKLYSFAFVYTGALHQADGTRRCPRWMAYALEQQVNLALGFSRIESECHPRITNMHVGGNGPPIELCNKLGKPGECGWVINFVFLEVLVAAGRKLLPGLALAFEEVKLLPGQLSAKIFRFVHCTCSIYARFWVDFKEKPEFFGPNFSRLLTRLLLLFSTIVLNF